MESDTEDTQSEGQVEEVSPSGGAVIEMQEFSHTEENTYEVPMPSSSSPSSSSLSSSSSVVMGSVNPSILDPYPDIPPKAWLPPIMNIAPGSISRPTKEKTPSKFLEGGWVLHQGMQTEKVIKRVIHRSVQTASTKKKIIRHIHVQTDMPSVRGFRHVCNRKCLVEHTEHFIATHSCKKEIVKNVVHTGLKVVNEVQENLSASNI